MSTMTFIFAIYYPLLSLIWSSAPLEQDNTKTPYSIAYLSNQQLEKQASLFKQTKDPLIRLSMIRDLREANNPYVIDVLLKNLKSESNQDVIDEIFYTLYTFRKSYVKSKKSFSKSFITSPSAVTRGYANALYLLKNKQKSYLKQLLENEQDLTVLQLMRDTIYELKMPVNEAFLISLYNKTKGTAKGLVILELLGYNAVNLDKNSVVTDALKSDTLENIIAVLKGISQRTSVKGVASLAKVAKHKNPMVRAAVLLIPSVPEMESIFIQLASDTVANNRRFAVEKLGHYKDEKVINVLISKMSDSDLLVQKAVKNSLLNIVKPSDKEIINKIAATLSIGDDHDVAIAVLGALYCKKVAPIVAKLLKRETRKERRITMILYFKDVCYPEVAGVLKRFEKSQYIEERRAVAQAYGTLNNPVTFQGLIKLSNDKSTKVVMQAVLSMGKLKKDLFQQQLDRIMNNVSSPDMITPDVRSYAIWSTSRINRPTARTLSVLTKLITKKVIKMDGGLSFDAEYVRASALFALIDMKQDKLFLKTIKRLEGGILGADNSQIMKEYIRQVKCYREGKKPQQVHISTYSPKLTVKPIK